MIEAHNITNLEGGSLENAVKTDFGLEVKNSKKVTHGYTSQVYEASLGNDTVFIRINKESRVFEVEILGYEILKKQGIPVPKILGYKDNPPSIGHPTMIMSSAIGTTIDEANLSPEEEVVTEALQPPEPSEGLEPSGGFSIIYPIASFSRRANSPKCAV